MANEIDLGLALSNLEMTTVFSPGEYARALESTLWNDARDGLRRGERTEELERFDEMMNVLGAAEGSAALRVAAWTGQRLFPESQVGENSIVLYILAVGATAHRGADELTAMGLMYKMEAALLAERLGKEPQELTLTDLGHAILDGTFHLMPQS